MKTKNKENILENSKLEININNNKEKEIDLIEFQKEFQKSLKGNSSFNKILTNYDKLFNVKEIKDKSFEIIDSYEEYYNNHDIENIFINLEKITGLLIKSKKALLNDYTFSEKFINFILFRSKDKIIYSSFKNINNDVSGLKKNIKNIKEFNNNNFSNLKEYISLINNRIEKLKEFEKIIEKYSKQIKNNEIEIDIEKKNLFINLEHNIEENLISLIDIKSKLDTIYKIIENNNKIIEGIELKILIKLEPLIISIILSTNKKILNNTKTDIDKEIANLENEGIMENSKLKENNTIIQDINEIINNLENFKKE